MANPSDELPEPKTDVESTGPQGGPAMGLGAGIGPWAGIVDGAYTVTGPVLSSAPLAALGAFGSAYCGVYGWGYGPAAALVGTDAALGKNQYAYTGGCSIYGTGLAGYGAPWPGTYATYRIMSAHPTIALTAAVLAAAVMGTQWSFEQADDAPADAKDIIQNAIEPLRTQLVLDCLRALVMGWAGFEVIYEMTDGNILPAKCKYLLPDISQILVDAKGNFAGIKQGKTKVPAGKSILYVNDQEGGNLYGRSRHENCRRDWSNYLTDDDNLARLGRKAASIIPHVGYPAGTSVDQNGVTRSNFDIAKELAQGMAEGRPGVYPNLANLSENDLRNIPELAKGSLWAFGTIDMGSAGPSQQAILAVMAYRDAKLVRGWLMPERSVLQSQHSGLGEGDSKNHGELGLTNADLVLGSIIKFVNESIVNPLLEWNWGAKYSGKVYAKAAPGDPDKLQFFRQLALAMMANPQALPQLLGSIEKDAWLDAIGLPKSAESVNSFDVEALKPPPPPVKPDPNNPQDKPNNSNGQAKTKPTNRFG